MSNKFSNSRKKAFVWHDWQPTTPAASQSGLSGPVNPFANLVSEFHFDATSLSVEKLWFLLTLFLAVATGANGQECSAAFPQIGLTGKCLVADGSVLHPKPSDGFLEANNFYRPAASFTCSLGTKVTSGTQKGQCVVQVPGNAIVRNEAGVTGVYVETTASICTVQGIDDDGNPSTFTTKPVSLHVQSGIKNFCKLFAIPSKVNFSLNGGKLYTAPVAHCPAPLLDSRWDGRGCRFVDLPACVQADATLTQWSYTPFRPIHPSNSFWTNMRVLMTPGDATFTNTGSVIPGGLVGTLNLKCTPAQGGHCPDTITFQDLNTGNNIMTVTACGSGCSQSRDTLSIPIVASVKGTFSGQPPHTGDKWWIELSSSDLRLKTFEFSTTVAPPDAFVPGDLYSAELSPASFIGGKNGKDPTLTMMLDGLAPPEGFAVSLDLSRNDYNVGRIMGSGHYVVPGCGQTLSLSWFLGTTRPWFGPRYVEIRSSAGGRSKRADPMVQVTTF